MASAPVFYTGAEEVAADLVRLDGAVGRHASVVRRLRPDESVLLSDGAGNVAVCRIAAVDPHGITCAVQRRYAEPRPDPQLVVVQALPKGSRGELAVELLTEVGADVIVPWTAARCVTVWDGQRGQNGLRRWRAAARQASQQSRRAWLPQVSDPVGSEEVGQLLAGAVLPLVLHESAEQGLTETLVPETGDIVVVVGPEGGLDDAELATFANHGAQQVRLGPTVLRTSTAGAAAIAVVLSRTPRWRTRDR
jgi:16S rRNA (uracil1498-N3)-methyltransferase